MVKFNDKISVTEYTLTHYERMIKKLNYKNNRIRELENTKFICAVKTFCKQIAGESSQENSENKG